jgi:hypothetical protein
MRYAILLLLPALLWAEDTKAKTEKKKRLTAGEVEIPDPGPPVADSAIARREVARFNKEWRKAKSREERLKLLDRLANVNHAVAEKTLSKYVRDKDYFVAVTAVVAVARQSEAADRASRTLLGCLKREKRTDVVCAALVGLGKLGCDDRSAVREAMSYFRKDTKEPHKAATRYFGYIKHKPAFRLLAEKLDEPRAKNPNDPNNPPASWWKERWHEWESNVKYTRWALSQLVEGETFETTNEAKTWAEEHGKDHDIEW